MAGEGPIRSDAEREVLREWTRKAERMYAVAESFGEKRSAQIVKHALEQWVDNDNPGFMHALRRMKRTPWTIDEFLYSKEFMASGTDHSLLDIWPALQQDILKVNPDVMIGETPVHELLLGGATGTGKSTVALVTTLNQALLLTCFREPQRLYRLPAATPIVFALASVSLTVIKRAIYTPLRSIFEAMPFVQKNVEFNRLKESEIHITDTNVTITPILAHVTAIIGQAIAGGAADEVNFFAIVENSKNVAGATGQGGRWDQAEEFTTTISRRRKSRFTTRGVSFGTLVLSSSTRYEGDFLDRRIDQVIEFKEPNVVAYRHKQYDVQPQDRYSGEKIRVLVGNDTHATRVLRDDEVAGDHYPESSTVELVPKEYEFEFRKDPENALRDIIGKATKAIAPFFTQRHKIVEAVLAGREAGIKQLVTKMDVDLIEDGMPQIDEANLPDDLETPRAIHVDLSRTSDRCGIAMAKIVEWVDVIEKDHKGNDIIVSMPRYQVEMAISIKPHVMKPLDISDVRKWILMLSKFYGFNIAMVTYDGFDSQESVQLLRKAGVRSENISMDTTPEPYEYLRRVIYEDRMEMTDSELLRLELVSLEWTKERKKVDHPPKGSKDVADAVCGAIFALSKMRSTRAGLTVVSGESRERVRIKHSDEDRREVSRPKGQDFTRRRRT